MKTFLRVIACFVGLITFTFSSVKKSFFVCGVQKYCTLCKNPFSINPIRSMFREPIRCPETSVPNYERPLRNILEVRRPLLHRDGNQKLRKVRASFRNVVPSKNLHDATSKNIVNGDTDRHGDLKASLFAAICSLTKSP